MLKETVGEEEVAAIISRNTGIPIHKIMEGEKHKVLNLFETLKNASLVKMKHFV